jgi:uncharacterized membrane protein YidH (DUF202 family)
VIDAVSSDYFRALNLPLVRGRTFTDEEAFDARADEIPSILSETLARTLFGSVDVIGRELRTPWYNSPSTVLRIVGVTGPSRFAGIDRPPDAMLYQPLARFPSGLGGFVLVRSALGEAAAARLVAHAARDIDPSVPVAADQTFAAVIDELLGERRLFAWLLGLLGCVGFVLSAVGLHGLVAQTVTERRREFGIRLAIGANRMQVIRPVLGLGAMLGAAGVAAGLILAWWSGRTIENRLFGVTARNPWVFVVSGLLIVAVVTVATFGPAHAATRVDPVDVLRAE